MPAMGEEIEHAQEEGIKFVFLAGPRMFAGKSRVEKFYYDPMKLGDYDASGRKRPVSTGEEPVEMEADWVINATGQINNTVFLPVLKENGQCSTEAEGIFAAGDCATGPASVIKAIAAGKKAAAEVDTYLGGSGTVEGKNIFARLHFVEVAEDGACREKAGYLPVEKRIPGFAEVELGLKEDDARKEASRCLHCGCINCRRCVAACSYQARTLDYPVMKVNEDLCRNCGLCVSVCPTGALTATVVDQ